MMSHSHVDSEKKEDLEDELIVDGSSSAFVGKLELDSE